MTTYVAYKEYPLQDLYFNSKTALHPQALLKPIKARHTCVCLKVFDKADAMFQCSTHAFCLTMLPAYYGVSNCIFH